MKLYKDNIIDKNEFDILITLDPDVVKNMIRYKIKIDTEDDEDDVVDEDEINVWVRNNCNGLVYFDNEFSTRFREHLVYCFEFEEDMVAFKIMWS